MSSGYKFEGKQDAGFDAEGMGEDLIQLNYSLEAFRKSVSFWYGDLTVNITDVTLYTDGEELKGVYVGGEDGHGNYLSDTFGELAPSSVAELAQELFEQAKKEGHI